MPDPDPSPRSPAPKRPQDYPITGCTATPSLEQPLHARILRDGPLRFADFMAAALYDPDFGYYSRGSRQIGRGGDFFTSVSVGPLFGELLARRFLRHWQESGQPRRWRIIESGAHDGTLALDVLGALARLDARALESLDYVIAEPLPGLQTAQLRTLEPYRKQTRVIQNPLELEDHPLPGIAFGNEVLDALPCHLVEWHAGDWLECRVGPASNGSFAWETQAIGDPLLRETLILLGCGFPDDYRTEVRTCYRGFLEPLARALTSGLMIWADYGFARPEYYHPARTAGTLRTFSQHRAGTNPLENPGHADITAHVDFTAVAEAALALGGRPTLFSNQGAWLTQAARDWLLAQEGNPQPKALRHFQTLTHPAQLGSRFHILELSWNPAASPPDPDNLCRHLFGSVSPPF